MAKRRRDPPLCLRPGPPAALSAPAGFSRTGRCQQECRGEGPQTGSPRQRWRQKQHSESFLSYEQHKRSALPALTLNTLPKAPSPSSPMISQNSSGFKSLLTCSYCFFFFSPPNLKILRKLKKDILAAAEGWGGRRCPLCPPGPPGAGGDAERDSHAETKVLASPGKRRHHRALRGDDTPRCPVRGRARRCSARRARRSLLGGAGHHRGSNKCRAPSSGRAAAEPEEGSRLRWEGQLMRAGQRGAVTSRLAGRGGGCPARGSRPVSSRSGVPGWHSGRK